VSDWETVSEIALSLPEVKAPKRLAAEYLAEAES